MSTADFIAACHDVLRERRTGVLSVEAEGLRTFLYFRDGVLVFAEQGSLGETLGRILVRQGTLTAAQYAAILERMTEELIQSEQARFGEVAIQLGHLTPEQVDEALREQVRRKFLHCLQWEISTCSFVDGEDEIGGLPRYPMPFEPLLLDGVRQHFDDERCAAVLGPLAALYPELREDAETLARRFRLDARGLRLLRVLDGTRTLRATLDAAPAGLETRPLLVALVVSNALRLTVAPVAPRAVASPVGAPSGAGASPTERREDSVIFVVRPPSQEPAPPRLPTPKPAPPPKVERVARLESERAFQLGRKLLAEESWAGAARELRRAATLFPEPLEYGLAAGWAELRAGAEGADRQEQRAELRKLAERASQQDRGLALAHHVLGHLAFLDGELDAARRSLEAALTLEPGNADASRTLRQAERRADEAKLRAPPSPPGRPAPPPRDKAAVAAATGPSAKGKGAAAAGASAGGGSKGKRAASAAASDRALEHAVVARSSGDVDAAVALLRAALKTDPDEPRLVAELALCVLLADPRGNAREANGLARRARTANPQLALPWVVAGLLLEPLGERDRAAQLYRHALSLDPDCAEAQSALDRLG